MTFDKCVVRRFRASLYLNDHEPLAVLLMKRKVDLRHRIHLHLDRFADELGVRLRVGKTDKSAVIRNAEEQRSTLCIGERADALESTRRILALKHQLLVVGRRLAYVVIQVQLQALYMKFTHLSMFPKSAVVGGRLGETPLPPRWKSIAPNRELPPSELRTSI